MDAYHQSYGGMKRHHAGDEAEANDQKRIRQGDGGQGSKVIVVRGLPNDCLESELLALVGPFSAVERCIMNPSKNEALVHLPDVDAATSIVNFYQARDAVVRGQKVAFAFSSREDTTSHSSSAGASQSSSSQRSNGPPHDRNSSRGPSSYDRRNDRPPASADRSEPRQSAFDRQPPPRHDRPYDHVPPTSFDRNGPPSQRDDRGPPSYDRHGPPSFDRNVPPPSYDRNGPPSAYDRNAPPQSAYDRNAPPSSYDRNAPPSSYDRNGPGGSYSRNGPPPTSYQQQQQPTSGYPASSSMQPTSGFDRPGALPPGKNTILMVTVSKMEYPVNVDILHQVFSKYGTVMKIVTFTQRDEFKSLVQLQTTEQAESAQSALDGRDIYTGCNTLHIQMSTHKSLNVQYNNDKMRDYFNPHLPTHDPSDKDASRGMLGDMPPQRQSGFSAAMNQPPRDRDYRGPPPHMGAAGPASYGGPQGGAPYGGHPGGPPPRRDDSRDRRGRSRSRERRSRSRERDGGPYEPTGQRSTVLICSNIDPRYVKLQSLFTIFGCFGDVLRIKIMFRKTDTALIQFVDERHAQSARDHTDGLVLCGKKMRVDYSKHLTIIMPRPDADQFEIQNTRDFTNSPYHRYRKRSIAEVCPPTTLLHISGIPVSMQLKPGDTVSTSRLLGMFAEWGVVKKYHPIAKQPKMVLLEMGTLEEAVDAMIALDNFTFNDGRIRVSFSKSYQRQ